jgi:hypothetical protein
VIYVLLRGQILAARVVSLDRVGKSGVTATFIDVHHTHTVDKSTSSMQEMISIVNNKVKYLLSFCLM